jgi:geranylgeranyl pyrophosphate synthase
VKKQIFRIVGMFLGVILLFLAHASFNFVEYFELWNWDKTFVEKYKRANFPEIWEYTYIFTNVKNGTTDTIVLAPGDERISVLATDLRCVRIEYAWDNWRARHEGTWWPAVPLQPHKKKAKVSLRKIEYVPVQVFRFLSCPLSKYRGDYFAAMQDVGNEIDSALENFLARFIRPPDCESLAFMKNRKGAPKLRPFLAYVFHRMYGGEMSPKAFAFIEMHTRQLYMDNHIFDNKKLSRENISRLVLENQHADFYVSRMIAELNLPAKVEVELLQKMSDTNSQSHNGQYYRMAADGFYGLFGHSLMTGMPYAFTCESGAVLAGVHDDHLLDCVRKFGRAYGSARQLMDDMADFSLQTGKYMKDVYNKTYSLPVMTLSRESRLTFDELQKLSVVDLQKLFFATDTFQICLDVLRKDVTSVRRVLYQLPNVVERDFLSMSISGLLTNKHMRNLKKLSSVWSSGVC